MFLRLLIALFVLATFADAGECQPGFVKHGGSCYWFSTGPVSFIDAKGYCESMTSHLVHLTSVAENEYIRKYLEGNAKTKGYWIGASDVRVEGQWMWLSKYEPQPVIYKNWSPGEPNNSNGENCAILHRDTYKVPFEWVDERCNIEYGYICEQD